MQKYIQCIRSSNENVTQKETIYAIKNAGFDGAFIQLYGGDSDFSFLEQLNLCREIGLDVPFVHLSYKGINEIWIEGVEGDTLVDNYLKDLEFCKKEGINLVVMHLSSKKIAPEPNIIGIRRIKKIVDYAEKLGIKIAFENTKIWGYLEYVFEHIKNKNVGICFDLGHCHCHFDSKFSWDIFKDKIFVVHFHDNDRSADLHLLPFDGTADWDYFVSKLKEANYSGPITLESAYSKRYLDMQILDFYKLALDKAKQIKL